MKFKKGETIKGIVVENKFKIVEVKNNSYDLISIHTGRKIDDVHFGIIDGYYELFVENPAQVTQQKPNKFEVGDIIVYKLTNTRYKITEVRNTYYILKDCVSRLNYQSSDFEYLHNECYLEEKNNTSQVTKAAQECCHEWMHYEGLGFNQFDYCVKCDCKRK
jgi:hypothetical protein